MVLLPHLRSKILRPRLILWILKCGPILAHWAFPVGALVGLGGTVAGPVALVIIAQIEIY